MLECQTDLINGHPVDVELRGNDGMLRERPRWVDRSPTIDFFMMMAGDNHQKIQLRV
jgi:hypothetical protein